MPPKRRSPLRRLIGMVADEIPGSELLNKEHRRPRAKKAPDGWVAAEAIVTDVDRGKPEFREGRGRGEWDVCPTRICYVVLDEAGAPREVTDEIELLGEADVPPIGAVLTIAYDPAKPDETLVLEDEGEWHERQVREIREFVGNGRTYAPATVVSAIPTGRVRHRRDKSAAAELVLTLRVEPAGLPAFEVQRHHWDLDFGLHPGQPARYFFLPKTPVSGWPLFSKSAHRAGGGDGLDTAQAELIAGLRT